MPRSHWTAPNKVRQLADHGILTLGGGAGAAIQLAVPDKVDAQLMQSSWDAGTKGKSANTLAQQNALHRELNESLFR